MIPATRNSYIAITIAVILFIGFTFWVVTQMYEANVNLENQRTYVCREAAVGSERYSDWCEQ